MFRVIVAALLVGRVAAVQQAGACRCKYQGSVLPRTLVTELLRGSARLGSSGHVSVYGTQCAAWDLVPGTPLYKQCHVHRYSWCFRPWCYVDEACSNKTRSDVWVGRDAYYSYKPCSATRPHGLTVHDAERYKVHALRADQATRLSELCGEGAEAPEAWRGFADKAWRAACDKGDAAQRLEAMAKVCHAQMWADGKLCQAVQEHALYGEFFSSGYQQVTHEDLHLLLRVVDSLYVREGDEVFAGEALAASPSGRDALSYDEAELFGAVFNGGSLAVKSADLEQWRAVLERLLGEGIEGTLVGDIEL